MTKLKDLQLDSDDFEFKNEDSMYGDGSRSIWSHYVIDTEEKADEIIKVISHAPKMLELLIDSKKYLDSYALLWKNEKQLPKNLNKLLTEINNLLNS